MSADAPAPGIEAQALNHARRAFELRGEVGVRLAFVDCGPDRGLIIAAIPVEGPDDPTLLMLRGMLAKERARGVAILSEAWGAEAAQRRDLPADLSTYAGRTELVMVLVEHRDLDGGATRMWQATITRDAAGAPTLGPFSLRTGPGLGGRMTRLLPRGAIDG